MKCLPISMLNQVFSILILFFNHNNTQQEMLMTLFLFLIQKNLKLIVKNIGTELNLCTKKEMIKVWDGDIIGILRKLKKIY